MHTVREQRAHVRRQCSESGVQRTERKTRPKCAVRRRRPQTRGSKCLSTWHPACQAAARVPNPCARVSMRGAQWPELWRNPRRSVRPVHAASPCPEDPTNAAHSTVSGKQSHRRNLWLRPSTRPRWCWRKSPPAAADPTYYYYSTMYVSHHVQHTTMYVSHRVQHTTMHVSHHVRHAIRTVSIVPNVSHHVQHTTTLLCTCHKQERHTMYVSHHVQHTPTLVCTCHTMYNILLL